MKTRLQDTWAAGRAAINGWLAVPSPVTAELTARADFDSVTVDLQHGLIDYQAALTMLQAMSASGATPMARAPWLDPGLIMKLLDAGALGIVCPMINTAEDAENLVRYARYAPRGVRSFGPTRAGVVYGAQYWTKANASATARSDDGKWRIALFGSNITNEQILRDLVAADYMFWHTPRQIGLEVGYRMN